MISWTIQKYGTLDHKTDIFVLFENQFDHPNARLVQYFDGYFTTFLRGFAILPKLV